MLDVVSRWNHFTSWFKLAQLNTYGQKWHHISLLSSSVPQKAQLEI